MYPMLPLLPALLGLVAALPSCAPGDPRAAGSGPTVEHAPARRAAAAEAEPADERDAPARAEPPPLPERPNVVLIVADDLGYEGLGCNGGGSYATPNLDALAAGGVRFEHCYSQPLCTPSRVKLMTGKYNFRNYVGFGTLDPEETNFAHLLAAAGYATAIAGKWQLGGLKDAVGRAGFERYCLWHLQGRPSRYWKPRLMQDGHLLAAPIQDRFGPDVISDFALEFVSEERDRPFFLYYPMVLPHWPFVPTPDSPERGSRGKGRVYDRLPGGEEYFPDMVAYLDQLVGRLVRRLDELELRDETLILFTCDNGSAITLTAELDGEEVRGGKAHLTDAGTRVPLIASWPGVLPAGHVTDTLVDFSDFLPTLAEAAGAELPPDLVLDGQSFLPQMRGLPGTPREWVFCHYNGRPEWVDVALEADAMAEKKLGRFARDQRYKLYLDGRFYDVAADREERTVLVPATAEQRAAHARLKAALDSMPPWEYATE